MLLADCVLAEGPVALTVAGRLSFVTLRPLDHTVRLLARSLLALSAVQLAIANQDHVFDLRAAAEFDELQYCGQAALLKVVGIG